MVKYNNTCEELIMKSIGIMELIPDRINELEKELSNLKSEFSFHDGEQKQGIKRTDERIIQAKEELDKLKIEFETLKNSNVDNEKMLDITNNFRYSIETLKAKFEEIKDTVAILNKEYTEREENKKTLKEYLSEAVKGVIRYAMLPICIILLLSIGIDPKYIPWYKESDSIQKTDKQDTTGKKIKAIYEKIKLFYKRNDSKYILEEEIKDIYYCDESDEIIIIREAQFDISKYPNKIILWLPENNSDGYLYYNGDKLLVKRK